MQPSPERLAKMKEDEERFQDAFEQAQQGSHTPQAAAYLRQIEEGYRKYHAEIDQLRDEVARNGPFKDFPHLAETHPIRDIVESCKELGKINRQQLADTVEDSNRTSGHAHLILLLLGLGGPIGGVFCGYGLSRGLTRSITRLQLRVRDVADQLTRTTPLGVLGAETSSLPGLTLNGHGEIDLGAVTVDVDAPLGGGDLGSLEVLLQRIHTQVEEVIERLHRQQREIQRAEQLAALGQLAAGIAHEVRNPLTGMKMLVEAALHPGKRQVLTDEDLRVILGEITRLEQTVQHFLDFARPPALRRQEVDVRDLVQRTVELLRPRARHQAVRIRLQLPDEPVTAAVDPGMFGTVLVNLLVNALDMLPLTHPGGGGEIKLTLGSAEAPGMRCCLSIEDNGPGIAVEVADRLFTPFVSGRPTGTGLGLALSRSVIQEHGGSIEARNRPAEEGGGACFRILLPLQRSEVRGQKSAVSSQPGDRLVPG
jgi:signal transduction histidine kinase